MLKIQLGEFNEVVKKKLIKADHYFQEAIWFLGSYKVTLHNIKVVDGLCFHSLFCQPIRRETEETMSSIVKIIHLGCLATKVNLAVVWLH